MNPINSMWTEKYRPKRLNEMVGEFKSKIENYLKDPQSMQHLLLASFTAGTGKCLGKNTPIIMFDGSIKKVQCIKEGDLLMGPDSKPRIVKGVTKGKDDLYIVRQNNGDDFVVNEHHILATTISGTDEKRLIRTKDYYDKTENYHNDMKSYKTGIEFKSKKTTIDPYFLGVWLGDGHSSSIRVSNPDVEIIKYLDEYANILGLKLTNHNGDKTKCPQLNLTSNEKCRTGRGCINNKLLNMFKELKLINNKHIPNNYLYNSTENRLSLLAGLIDTDGYKDGQGYEITQKNKTLAYQIVYLSRSLGFRTSIKKVEKGIKKINFKGVYYKIHINGEVWKIPCKVERKKIFEHKRQKNCLVGGFEVEYIGKGNYYGFTVDKDGLFLLGDFTVTHNTTLAKVIINEISADALILNSSLDRKIETIREKVRNFAQTKSSKDGVRRIVFLDEIDGMRYEAQDSLRNVMETYASNVLFILTCNKIHKVSDAIKSRCAKINFTTPNKNEIYEYLKKICVAENLEFTEEGLNKIIDFNYPSIRNCVQVLQEIKTEGKSVTTESAKTNDDINEQLWKKITIDKDWKYVREYIFTEAPDVSEINKYFWFKAVMEDNIKMIQITAANEVKFNGSDEIVVFVTSLIEMIK